ncbi:MAG: putative SNF1A/AMP-activated protein kinase [Streblomastix strix]|uniref:Putative SNF1A/AMP-activated protein kinase n=1 Tax=Streblomastix strix TaxID=222440 RepID=A0A5J4VWM7_9EUKA|nr:MAG: putative SNF1A/AMP-activated protein kinase [Streblomastix strix]
MDEDVKMLKDCGIEIINLLGYGASGRVYLSINKELGIIAAKVMKIEKFDQREWDAAGRLNLPQFQCPYIIKYLRAKAFDNNVVILMSYANAKSLDVIIEDKKQNLQSEIYKALSKQIFEAVRVIHASGIIHRDIKAANILLHSENGSTKVKIADFGTAKVITSMNMNVTALGEPQIMAPELLLGTSVGTNKVDMWSVGVVLFQLATHEYPIKANSIPDLYRKMMSGRINRPSEIKDDLLWDLLSKLLEFDPDKRITAEQALKHPYFTSPQVLNEVSLETQQIAQNYERQLDNEV